MRPTLGVLLFGTWLAAACGYTDAGDGTQTLNVTAVLSYHLEDNETHIALAVKRNLDFLPGAQVTLRDDETGELYTIPEVAHPTQNYRDHIGGHHRRLELSVVAGADNLTARIEGPGPFVVPQPEHNRPITIADLGEHLTVKWRPDDGLPADEVRVRLERADVDQLIEADEGHYQIRSIYLETGSETLRVERINRVLLAGGTPGSFLTSGYEVRNDFVVQ